MIVYFSSRLYDWLSGLFDFMRLKNSTLIFLPTLKYSFNRSSIDLITLEYSRFSGLLLHLLLHLFHVYCYIFCYVDYMEC